MSTPLLENDLRLFADTIKYYLNATSGLLPDVTSAFLGDDTVQGHEFNGIIDFSGGYRGSLLVSMPRTMLREILILQHERQISEAILLDAVGEVANTLAGNARNVFGSDLDISVPRRIHGVQRIQAEVRDRPYIITFLWGIHPGLVCVDMERE